MIGSIIGQEIIKAPVKIDNDNFKLLAGSRYIVGGYCVTLDSDLLTTVSTSLDSGNLTANTLYYVYLVVSSNTYKCVLSLNANAPVGYLAYKQVGFLATDSSNYIMGVVQQLGDWQYDISGILTGSPVIQLVNNAKALVKKVGEGKYVANINIFYTVAVASRVGATLVVNGLSGISSKQSGAANTDGNIFVKTNIGPSNGIIELEHVSTTTSYYSVFIAPELMYKPTFALLTP